jgi:putative tryptophan/tyrosine transport system substrate-binding protein
LSSDLAGKRLQLLREAYPTIARVAILWDPGHADADFEQTQTAATALGMQLHSHEVRGANELDAALEAITSQGAQGLVVVPSRLTLLYASRIGDFATRHHLPIVSGWGVFTRSGGLLSYGPNLGQAVRRAAAFVAKILKGAKPGELPIERPTAFEMVLNLKTAQELGLAIPLSVVQQATEVIQ